MSSKTLITIIIPIFIIFSLVSCQEKPSEDIKKFTDSYESVTAKLKETRSKVKNRDQYVAYKAEKKKEYETLLEKFAKSPNAEEIEVLRSKTLLQLGKLDEALKKIDGVLAKNPDNAVAAKMVKIKIYLEKQNFEEAYKVFKGIEAQVKNPDELFTVYYALGTEHPANRIRERYANKFLEAKQVPKAYANKKSDLFFSLADIAKQQGENEKARKLLNDGIGSTDDEQNKKLLSKTIEQLDYLGKPAFPLAINNWLNSEKLNLGELKGKVVVLSFWAPWCPSCRQLMPTLIELYDENKDKDFAIIGYTRLYGKYRDNVVDVGKVSPEEELEQIKKHLDRNKIKYPIAIANERAVFDNYKISGIPTLVFLNKKGEMVYTNIGSSNVQFIKEKIKKLLEES